MKKTRIMSGFTIIFLLSFFQKNPGFFLSKLMYSCLMHFLGLQKKDEKHVSAHLFRGIYRQIKDWRKINRVLLEL